MQASIVFQGQVMKHSFVFGHRRLIVNSQERLLLQAEYILDEMLLLIKDSHLYFLNVLRN